MQFGAHAITVRQLQYIVAVAEERSFRRAAERCFVSQPALSTQVAELERALGIQLFERQRRRFVITPAGESILQRARRVLMAMDDLVESARHSADPLCGVLNLGVIPTISPYLLPIVDPATRAAFPDLDLRWFEDRTATLVADVTSGALDGAVLALEADLGGLAWCELGVDPFVLAAPPGHRLARASGPIPADALIGEHVLLLDEGHCFRDQALALCAETGAEETAFRATSLSTVAQMAAGGSGLTLLPEMAVALENRHGRLAIRRFADPAPRRTIVLAWRDGSPWEEPLRRVAREMRTAWPG